VRHGYCVGRKACRAQPDLFGGDLPGNAPWDPVSAPRGGAAAVPAVAKQDGPARAPSEATAEARALQPSAFRRIWSTLLDPRDWVSYVYVPIILPIIVLLPYVALTWYEHTHRLNQLVESYSQGTRDLETLNEILENKAADWTSEHAERVRNLDDVKLDGFGILQDSRIVDLRHWQPGASGKADPKSVALVHRRLKVVKQRENTGNNLFRVRLLPTSPKTEVRFPAQQLPARLRVCDVGSSVSGEEECRWEASFDFQRVPPGEFVDLVLEERSPGHYLQHGPGGSSLSFFVQAETAELTTWLLMPRGKEYRNFRIARHEPGKPETTEAVHVVTEYVAEDSTIIAFKLLALKPGWEYEVSWSYK
jgi:hypothetical protein